MAIAVWTNSNVSPNKSVSLTTLSVSGYNAADLVESVSLTKTSFTTNTTSSSSPVNIYTVSPVYNVTPAVTGYTATDNIESLSILKRPFTSNVPSAAGYGYNQASYTGSYTVNTIRSREIWITG